MRDGVTTGLEKRVLFERYRPILEVLASELFDEHKYFRKSNCMIVVRVPNGGFEAARV